MEEVNAKITATQFGVEDHGILTFYVMLEWSGGGQGLGGFSLDGYCEETKSRDVGYGPGLVAMRRILETTGVDRWERLPGTLVRVRHHGWGSSKPPVIGHILEDKWFDLEQFMQEAREDPCETA